MYAGYPGNSTGAVSALVIFIGALLVAAVVGGVALGNSERFNPSLAKARVDKLRAEAASIRAQTAHDQHQRQLELEREEQQNAIRAQALLERQAVERKLLELAGYCVLFVGSVAVLTLAIGISYYWIEKGVASRTRQAF